MLTREGGGNEKNTSGKTFLVSSLRLATRQCIMWHCDNVTWGHQGLTSVMMPAAPSGARNGEGTKNLWNNNIFVLDSLKVLWQYLFLRNKEIYLLLEREKNENALICFVKLNFFNNLTILSRYWISFIKVILWKFLIWALCNIET